MAKLYPMHRAVYFSSPADWKAGAPADWMSAEPNGPRRHSNTRLATSMTPFFPLANCASTGRPWVLLLSVPRPPWTATTRGLSALQLLTTSVPGNNGGAGSPTHGHGG